MIRGLIQTVTWVAGKLRRFSGTGLPGQNFHNREIIQHHGFASNPPAGTKAVFIKNGNNIVCIAEDAPDRRPDLDDLDAECAMYGDTTHCILIKTDGSIIIKSDQQVVVDATDIKIGGSTLLPISGVVTGECLCAFTGAPHIEKSLKVKAAK